MGYYQNLAKELPGDENNNLAIKAKTDKECRDKLIIHNTRLVMYFANKYDTNTFLTTDDLFQEGILGLIKAVDNYDPDKGKFSNYAVWYIKQSITRAIGDTERTIRIPIHMLQDISDMEKIKKRISKEEGREATPIEIAAEMNVKLSKVKAIIKASNETTTSLNTPIAGDGEEITLMDAIEHEGPTPEEIAEAKVFIEQFIQEFKKQLKPLEIDSIVMYYGLKDGICYTYKQIANKYNCSLDNVRQYKEKALKKIRKSLFIKGLINEVDEEISFYPAIDYTRIKSSKGTPSSPVEGLAMKRDALLKNLNSRFFYSLHIP